MCAALLFATALGGVSDASAQGMIARIIAGRAQAQQASTASVVQTGDNNGAAVSQQGAGNTASMAQDGADNTGVLRQNGDDNSARLVQLGHGNNLAATQNNSNNALCYIQRGANLSGEIVQNGGEGAIIVQNAQGARVVTNRVPRWCMANPPQQGNGMRGAWRGR